MARGEELRGAPPEDLAGLLDRLRGIAAEGLRYAQDPHDQERYTRLDRLVTHAYANLTGLGEAEVSERFARELGTLTPKLGVDAAVVDPDGRILLVERADGSGWSVPGGWLHPDESPEHGVERETLEETGLRVRTYRLVDVSWRPAALPDRPHGSCHLTYLCGHVGGTIEPGRAEVSGAAFLHADDAERWHTDHRQRAEAALAAVKRPVSGS